jgi:hypothetical protein
LFLDEISPPRFVFAWKKGGISFLPYKIVFSRIFRIPSAVFALFFITAISSFLVPPVTYSGEIILTWDGNRESNVAGYKLYFGTAPGNYSFYIDTGKNTVWTLKNLAEGETYFITVTAYDLSGNESGFSPELKVALPTASGADNFSLGINCGGPRYLDPQGILYQADAYFSGAHTYQTAAGIERTVDDPLYQSERFGDFSYNIPLENGNYMVTLKFAEIFVHWSGGRVFDVEIQGQKVLCNFDIFALAGKNRAYDITFPASVTAGLLTIGFQTIENNAKVSAILIKRF